MTADNDVLTLKGSEVRRLQTAPFAVLPVGSIEYHGPGGPLGVDTTLAAGLAARVAAARGGLAFPPIAYTFVPRLTRAHGPAVSVAPRVFLDYVTEVIAGVLGAGVSRLLVLNGHSENQYALRLAAEQVTERLQGSSVVVCNWWKLAPGDLFSESGGHGHGGPLELSATAALQPRGVELAQPAGRDVPYEAPWWRAAAQVVGAGQEPVGFRGYHGRVSEADLAKGEEVVRVVVEQLVRLVDDWLERAGGSPTPPSPPRFSP